MTIYKNSKLVYLSIILILTSFYIWTGISSNHTIELSKKPVDYYNLQTEAFLNKSLALLPQPDARLLSLPDPYDPNLNAPYRLHDLTLYNNKYYLYFGVAPVITFLLPFHLLTGYYCPLNLAICVFLILGFMATTGVLNSLFSMSNIKISKCLQFIIFLTLGISTGAPILLRWPNIYELAVAAGFAFNMFAVYFYIQFVKKPHNKIPLALGSTCFGLAVASRPDYAIPLIFLLFTVFIIFVKDLKLSAKDRLYLSIYSINIKRYFYILLPLIIILFSLGIYNKLRFNSFTEFGINYQLSGESEARQSSIQFNYIYIIPSLYYFLLHPMLFCRAFPFVTFNPINIFSHLDETRYSPLEITSVFGLIPLNLTYLLGLSSLLILPILYRIRSISIKEFRLGLLISIFVFSILLFLCCYGTVSERYVLDFSPLLLVLSIWLLFLLLRYKKSVFNKIVSIIFSLTCLASIYLNFAISLSGYGNRGLQYQNKASFNSMASFFYSKSNTLKTINGLIVDGYISNLFTVGETRQLLFTSGTPGAEDCVYIERRSKNLFNISYSKSFNKSKLDSYISPEDLSNYLISVRTGVSAVYSNNLHLDEKATHKLIIQYAQMTGNFSVTIDEVVILAISTRLFPADPNFVRIYDNFNIHSPWLSKNSFSGLFKINKAQLYFVPEGPWSPRF